MNLEPWSSAGSSALGSPGGGAGLAAGGLVLAALVLAALVLLVLAAAVLATSRQARRVPRSPDVPGEVRAPLPAVGGPRRPPRHAAWLPGPVSGPPADDPGEVDLVERGSATPLPVDPEPRVGDVRAGDVELSGPVRLDGAGRPQLRHPRPGAEQADHLTGSARAWAVAVADADPSALLSGLDELQRSWPAATGSTAVAERRFRCDGAAIERDLVAGSLSTAAAVDAAVTVLRAVDAYWSDRDLLPRGCGEQLRHAARAAAAAARTGDLDPARRLSDALAEHWSQYRLAQDVDELLGWCVLRVQAAWSAPAEGPPPRVDLLATAVADLFVAREDIVQEQTTRLRWRLAALGFP